MKKTYILIPLMTIALITLSCQKSKEEKLIADYKQTFAGTKLDLNFEIRSLDKVSEITAKDSAVILRKTFEEKKNIKLKQLSESIKDSALLVFYKAQIVVSKSNKALESQIDYYENLIQDEKEIFHKLKEESNLYIGNCKGTFLEPLYLTIQQYETSPEKLLATEYHLRYSMENLNGAKLKCFERIFINAERTKVILSDQHIDYWSRYDDFL